MNWERSREGETGTRDSATETSFAAGIIRYILGGLWLFSDDPFTVISSRALECVVPPSPHLNLPLALLFSLPNTTTTCCQRRQPKQLFPLSKFLLVALSHFVTLYALRSPLSDRSHNSRGSACHAERKSFTFGVLLFDLITNLVSVVCPRNANIHLHLSVCACFSFSEILQPRSKSKTKTKTMPKPKQIFRLKIETIYANRLHACINSGALWENYKEHCKNFIIESAKVKEAEEESGTRDSFSLLTHACSVERAY